MDDTEQERPVEAATDDVVAADPVPDERSAAADDVELVRGFIVASDPALVPELVTGQTVSEVLASVEPARAAWRRIADHVRENQNPGARPVPSVPSVPAGGATAFVVDPSTLSAGEMIRRGLASSRRTG